MQRNTEKSNDTKPKFSVLTCRPYSFILSLFIAHVSKHDSSA